MKLKPSINGLISKRLRRFALRPLPIAALALSFVLCALPFVTHAARSLSPWERAGVRTYAGANHESSSSLRLSLSEKTSEPPAVAGGYMSSSLSPHPDPLPGGEGKSTIASLSWLSDRAWMHPSTVGSSPFALGALLAARTLSPPVPVGNQCQSLASGNWDSNASWTNCGGGFPGAGDDAFIQAGHTITLVANQACNDLNLDTTSAQTRLALGANTLSVNGKFRAFTGAAPGTATTTLSASNAWITSTTGKISVVGNTRTLTASTDWGPGNAGVASPNGFYLEINLTSGQTVTANTGIKARSFSVVAGTLQRS